jgi:cytochrome c oxidase subunit 1
MHIVGAAGHMRRISDPTQYGFLQHLQPLNQFMTICAFGLGIVQFIFVANFVYSLFWGPRASRNPWNSNTLEWSAPSPPPHGNFDIPPVVYRGPYEYASPETEADFWPQYQPGTKPAEAPAPAAEPQKVDASIKAEDQVKKN